jgi:hypothetical protein
MFHTTRITHWATVTGMTALLVGSAAAPASARPWSGDSLPSQSVAASDNGTTNPGHGNCALRRVGTQLVRCDSLTGAGVAAPPWVPQR